MFPVVAGVEVVHEFVVESAVGLAFVADALVAEVFAVPAVFIDHLRWVFGVFSKDDGVILVVWGVRVVGWDVAHECDTAVLCLLWLWIFLLCGGCFCGGVVEDVLGAFSHGFEDDAAGGVDFDVGGGEEHG